MKNKPHFGFIALAILVIWLSCNPWGNEIWMEDDPHYNPPPPDSIPIDTDTLPLVTDTCTVFYVPTTPKFSTWAINLNFPPVEYKFYVLTDGQFVEINLHNFLLPYGNSVEYFSGINICGIVTGMNAPTYDLNHGIFIKDGFGKPFMLTFTAYNWTFNGTLTFEQYMNELISHPSAKLFYFFNTAFTCDQYQEIWDFLLSDCKKAPNGGIINITAISLFCPMDTSTKDELESRGWTVIE